MSRKTPPGLVTTPGVPEALQALDEIAERAAFGPQPRSRRRPILDHDTAWAHARGGTPLPLAKAALPQPAKAIDTGEVWRRFNRGGADPERLLVTK